MWKNAAASMAGVELVMIIVVAHLGLEDAEMDM
jgi:hypothetical protein